MSPTLVPDDDPLVLAELQQEFYGEDSHLRNERNCKLSTIVVYMRDLPGDQVGS